MPVLHAHRHWGRQKGQPPLWAAVDIELQHPLALGLVGYWLLAGGVPGAGGRNLLTGVSAPVNTTPTGGAVGAAGRSFRCGPAGAGILTSGENYGASGVVEFTIACRLVAPTAANTGMMAARASGTARNSFTAASGTGNITYNAAYGATASAASSTPMAGLPRTLMGTTRSATDHELFLDGVSAATSTSSSGTSPGQRNQIIIGQVAGGGGPSSADFTFVAAWARGFSADEALLFAQDPYCFLIPAM